MKIKSKLFLVSIMIGGAFILPISVVDASMNNSRQETCPYLQENEIDWNEVIKVEILYDDGYRGEDNVIELANEHGVPIVYTTSAVARFTYFHNVSWITRDTGVSLSITPKNPYTIAKESSWTELVNFFQYHPIYKDITNPTKLSSMYNQYVCHADYARGFKTPWNIEPAKADKGYWGFASKACN